MIGESKIIDLLFGWVLKYFIRPELTIILTRAGGQKSPLRVITENIQEDGSNLVEINSIWQSRVMTGFKMIVRNNSEHQAYQIELLSPKVDDFSVLLAPRIDYNKPIPVNSELEYRWEIAKFFEGTGQQAYDLYTKGLPFFLENKIVITYKNVKGKQLYTEFDFSKDEKKRNTFRSDYPLNPS